MSKAKKEIEVQEKRSRAVELKTKGLSYAQMATELQCSKTYAFKLYQEALQEIPAEAVDEHRRLAQERLEYLWRQVTTGLATARDPSWVSVGVKILERHAKLFGLDMPAQIDHRLSVVPDDPLAKRILENPTIAERYHELVELATSRLPRPGGAGGSRNGNGVPPPAPSQGPLPEAD